MTIFIFLIINQSIKQKKEEEEEKESKHKRKDEKKKREINEKVNKIPLSLFFFSLPFCLI